MPLEMLNPENVDDSCFARAPKDKLCKPFLPSTSHRNLKIMFRCFQTESAHGLNHQPPSHHFIISNVSQLHAGLGELRSQRQVGYPGLERIWAVSTYHAGRLRYALHGMAG